MKKLPRAVTGTTEKRKKAEEKKRKKQLTNENCGSRMLDGSLRKGVGKMGKKLIRTLKTS